MLAGLYFKRHNPQSLSEQIASDKDPLQTVPFDGDSVAHFELASSQDTREHTAQQLFVDEPSRTYVTSAEIFEHRIQTEGVHELSTKPVKPANNRPHAGSQLDLPAAPLLLDEVPITARTDTRVEADLQEPQFEGVKIHRFSSRSSHHVANSIRSALQETLNEDSSLPLQPITDEVLQTKRQLFFETLFSDDNDCLLPARFDQQNSKQTLSGGLESSFGQSYAGVVCELSKLWYRLQ